VKDAENESAGVYAWLIDAEDPAHRLRDGGVSVDQGPSQ
jgi:hypothetical protein